MSIKNILLTIIQLPIIIICFIYSIIYGLFNSNYDFESGLEVLYSISIILYILVALIIICKILL